MALMPPPAGMPGAPPGAGASAGGPPQAAMLAALGRMRAPPAEALPGLGAQADGLAGLGTAVAMMQTELPKIAPGSEVHKAVLKAIQLISPHLPTAGGNPQTPGIDQLARIMQAVKTNGLLAHLMAAQGNAPGAPPMAPVTAPGG